MCVCVLQFPYLLTRNVYIKDIYKESSTVSSTLGNPNKFLPLTIDPSLPPSNYLSMLFLETEQTEEQAVCVVRVKGYLLSTKWECGKRVSEIYIGYPLLYNKVS
jgi:hypothetical protein